MASQLPEDWRLTDLRSVCQKTSVWNPAREKRHRFRYIDVSSVSNDRFCIAEAEDIAAASAPSRARKIVETGDVIYATVRPSLKRIAWIEPRYDHQIASTAFCVVRADPKQAVSQYLYFLLLSDELNRKIIEHERGASYPAVTDKDVLNQFVTLPAIAEQQKIAAVLWKIRKAVEIEDIIVRNARDLKKSLLRRLFTCGLRGEPLKETEIGPLPQSWVEVTIGSLGEIVTGTTPPTANRKFYDGGEFQFIAPADLGQTPFIYTAEKKITQQGLAVSRVLPKHSVCFVCIGSSIGKVGVTVEEVSATNQQINSVIVNSDYDPLFVGYLFEFKSSYIASFTSPSPVPILSKGKFEEINLFVSPDKDEQLEIADILKTVDRKIEVHESKSRSLQELFKTMLHKLMTGQIRVNDLDIDTSEVAV